jgi:sterol desaturase/sphingolipid hydroxylase (fatty acid hydroxylase superfamily)
MEPTLDWIISREFRQFILENNLFFPLLFLARLMCITGIELLRPARKVAYRRVILNDLTAFLAYQFVVFPLAGSIDRWIAIRPHLPETILTMPLILRLVCYLLIADFGHYWIHRLMHHKYVWRIHKWHHAPTYMYWLAGTRATVPQQVIVNLPYILAYSFLDLSPWWMYLTIGTFHALQNDWMHVNVTWRSNWLEWLVVTPRYHHIHHSDKPQHYMANLAAFFTIWDRLFGTYVNPDDVKEELSFGIGEEVPLLRLFLGV